MESFRKLESLITQTIKNKPGRNIILIRHGETPQNKVGQISGWADHRLSIKGREQANSLFQSLYTNIPHFKSIFTSDLQRAKDTCHIALGFPEKQLCIEDKRLRELNFGTHDNMHFSSLPKETQDLINSMEYHAPNGESWRQVHNRAVGFFKEKCHQEGTYLIFTHGGVICTITYNLGLQDLIANCSCVGIELHQETHEPQKILFQWKYPGIAETEI